MFDKFFLIVGVVFELVRRLLSQNLILAILVVVLVTAVVGALSTFIGFGWWGVPVGFLVAVLTVTGGALYLVLSTLNGGGRRK